MEDEVYRFVLQQYFSPKDLPKHDGEMLFLWVYDLSSNIRDTINSNTNHFIQEEHDMHSGFIIC